MSKLLRYFKGYVPGAIAAPLFKIIEAIIELILPLVVAYMIDVAIAEEDTGLVIGLGLAMVGMTAVGLGFSLACQYLASRSAVGFGCNLRRALYAKVQRLRLGDLDRMGTGTLVNRISADVAQTQQGAAMFLRLLLRAPFIAVGAIVMSAIVAPQLWYVSFAAGVLAFAVLLIVMKVSVPRFVDVQKKLDAETQITGETIKGERVIRAFTGEKRAAEKFAGAADAHRKTSFVAAAVSCLLNPLASVIVNLAIVLLLALGSGEVDGGAISQGDLVALINYMTQILLALMAISTLLVMVSRALSSAARIRAVLEMPETEEGEGAEPDENAPLIEMKNAAFSFGGEENAVGGLNFTLRRGEVLGVIGTTGSGKSTLAGLLTRFYSATEGEVRIAGNDVRDYTSEQLNSLVTIAPQKALLFSGTVRSNMEFSKETDDGEMRSALEKTEAWGFLSRKKGLDTAVNQKGSNFSGGEKQRLSLARALLKSAPVLVLDDAASALDYVTEARVMKNIMAECGDRAVVNISQRPGSLRHADKILVLDGGKVVGLGTHEELMRGCELYRRMNNNG